MSRERLRLNPQTVPITFVLILRGHLILCPDSTRTPHRALVVCHPSTGQVRTRRSGLILVDDAHTCDWYGAT